MARNANTYRAVRRRIWKAFKGQVPWSSFRNSIVNARHLRMAQAHKQETA